MTQFVSLGLIFPHHQNERDHNVVVDDDECRFNSGACVYALCFSNRTWKFCESLLFHQSPYLKNFLCIASEPLPTQFQIPLIVCIDEKRVHNELHSNRPSQFLDSLSLLKFAHMYEYYIIHLIRVMYTSGTSTHTHVMWPLILMSNDAFNILPLQSSAISFEFLTLVIIQFRCDLITTCARL